MARRPAPVDIGGIDKRRTGRDGAPGAPGSSTPGAPGRQGRQGPQGNPGTPYWSATEPDPLEHPVWGNLTDDTIYYWYAGTGPWLEQGTLGYGVADHEAAADPHPQYLTATEGDAAYEPVGAVAAHAAASDPHPGYLTPAEGNAAYAPLAHVGSGGGAHANVVAGGAAGFMTGTDKTKLDGIASPIVVGTYTPTASAVANVASVTPSLCFYRRVGDQVMVTGNVALSATAASTNTSFTLTLPVASNLAAFTDALGVGCANFTSSMAPARLIGDPAGDTITFSCVPPTTASANYAFQFSYRVL